MIPAKFSRRTFIKAGLASLVMGGCAPQTPAAGPAPTLPAAAPRTPTPTAPPTPSATATPVSLPSADGVVQRYLLAWEQDDFEAMYTLLTPESKKRTPLDQFYATYRHAIDQTTALAVDTDLQSLLADGPQATATFRSYWQTSLFDTLESDHTMTLRFEDGRWQIVWQPTLVLAQLGYGVTLALLEETVPRGSIFDALDRLLASHKQAITIGVVPGQITEQARLINALSPITGLKPTDIKQKISAARPDWFVPLADVSFETSAAHNELLAGLAGVDRRPHPVRTYPQKELAAHVVGTLGGIPAEQLESYRAQGYRGDELIGLTGVEGWGEPFLAGRRGGQLVTYSPNGKRLADVASARARPGGEIYLSLDSDLQARAEFILGAQRGAIVVMEPTGFIKAMASFPRFNPALFAAGITPQAWAGLLNDERRPLVNRATQGAYPPASVFKIVSIAAALEKLGYTPQTTFTCTGLWTGLGENFPKECWLKTGHGQINLQDGLTQSCDVVFYEVGLALHRQDPTLLPQMARAFGLGAPTGIMGLDEAGGVVPDDAWKPAVLNEHFLDGDAVNMAMGQGYALATPLQIARMLAAVGSGGRLYRPQIVRRLTSRDSGDQYFSPEEVGHLPLTPQTLAVIQEALAGVAHGRRGTARKAFEGVNYTVIGKTGTAETAVDAPHAWFAGYAPADTPAIVVAVILENAGEGSEKAAPLFRLMVESYFEWAGIDF
ncbi:MAG: penicillin-binding protein 2 [Anaerolineae bacterium]